MATNNSINTQEPITVSNGGTGVASIASNNVIAGSGIGAVTAISGSDNQILIGTTGADPSFSGIPAVTSLTLGAGSALSNYLETGSWTPDLQFGSAKVGITYSTQSGSYVRIGAIVYITIKIVLTSKGSSSGTASIEGLPVTIGTDARGITIFHVQNVTFANTPFCSTAPGGTTMTLFSQQTGATATALTDASFANNSELIITTMYFV